ncbi:hypothetical protein A2230_08440 [candidate division WOR-1 bacterium RIFOXYA2_FULL_36_21]|uniref:Uncharacterized protein n=1 Tax=candidate division WOR-1 bacterium RIFOXYB2_FULL_36_35 TaxID=1802578 RepID=A0A1F4S8A7_UNCSA|nr:MAG: hypothetical protein A2230_08440 [candidate division WOR-1 bacterium RIFOXYA2_FULL_36_21]OGC15336.1 MAG: hypothetical protein A2282_06190 [candidate division WOR-1 bacterium RIFOXYA12_FULL_36_13]OGC16678.1 MAG: hypothetical protein A2290_03655 [candidate division WOR-1 bacterium RIFOXYB2_FULL_36_35]
MFLYTSCFFCLVLFFCSSFSNQAFAYLDPGAGSYIFQILLAFFIGSIYSIKVFISKASKKIPRFKEKKDAK